MTDDIKALRLCYRLLSAMDDTAQDAAMWWLKSRLASDRKKTKEALRPIAAATRET